MVQRRVGWLGVTVDTEALPPERRVAWVGVTVDTEGLPPERRVAWVGVTVDTEGLPPERRVAWVGVTVEATPPTVVLDGGGTFAGAGTLLAQAPAATTYEPYGPIPNAKARALQTSPRDEWSWRDEFLVQPTTTHTHEGRGAAWGAVSGETCQGNVSYAESKVRDQHSMHEYEFPGIIFAEHRQHAQQFGTAYVDLPESAPDAIQVLEIKVDWRHLGMEANLNGGFESGLSTGFYHWGIGFNWMDPAGSVSQIRSLMLRWENDVSQTTLQGVIGLADVGNVYRAVTLLRRVRNVMPLSVDRPDVRLQVVLRYLPHPTAANAYLVVLDHWLTDDGGASWQYIGQWESDRDTIPPYNASNLPRLHDVYLGLAWEQDQGLTNLAYKIERYWDALTYLWGSPSLGRSYARVIG